ncbi:MAG: feruloyl-CoA synthase [Actinomycetota bacterium]|nr:feruloyl-CoA synthase [Actinomycetota bacterium]
MTHATATRSTSAVQTFAPARARAERRSDGCLLMRSADALAPHDASLVHAFRRGTEAHPDRLLVSERRSDGWHALTWGEVREQADRVAQGLLDRGLADRPVIVLSGNSAAHLVLELAAWTLGTPIVPTSVAYSLQSSDHQKLRAMAELVRPGAVFADDPQAFGSALAAVGDGRTTVTLTGTDGSLGLDELAGRAPTSEIDRRCAAVEADTLAKVLFTSGSTGTPKGVLNAHGQLAANQQQMRQVWPFLAEEPPVLLDWLPWSHTFGGNHNLNMVLSNGGSLWIDDGKPVPGLIERTVRNLQDVAPTLLFNVPAGYAALLPLLERDPESAARLFSRLRLVFFAAAALPQQLWDRLESLAAQHGSAMRMTTSWGLTETAPASTTTHFAVSRSDSLGVPLPGVELKLVPVDGKTEVRVRGRNVTAGYYERPDLTAAAFDDEGYFRTGDAVKLVDPDDPSQGLLFDGRIAEDFKLSSGTFVSVGTLRPVLLSAAGGLLQDAVICGPDAECVTALAWLHPDHASRCSADGTPEPSLRAELEQALQRLAAQGGGSSQRVERLLLLTSPPRLDAGEITDKGYVNQRAVRDARAEDVARVCAESCGPEVVVRP